MDIDIFVNGPHSTWINSCFGNNQFINIVEFKSHQESITKLSNKINCAALSVHWPNKFSNEFLNSYKYALNVHPGFLPIGRGSYPIFWSILDKTIAGATVHKMSSIIDDGPILFRKRVKYRNHHTSGDLWKMIFQVEQELVKSTINLLINNKKLKFFIPIEQKSIPKKKNDFLKLLNEPNLEAFDDDYLKRLILACTHHNYPLPDWISNLNTQNRFGKD